METLNAPIPNNTPWRPAILLVGSPHWSIKDDLNLLPAAAIPRLHKRDKTLAMSL